MGPPGRGTAESGRDDGLEGKGSPKESLDQARRGELIPVEEIKKRLQSRAGGKAGWVTDWSAVSGTSWPYSQKFRSGGEGVVSGKN